MTKRRTQLGGLLAIGVVALVVAGCGGGSGSSSSSSGSSASNSAGGTTLAAQSSPLGKILTTQGGRTLYLFAKDTGPKSMCSGACASNWPPFTAAKKPPVSGGASSTDVSLVRRSDGKKQVTYNGHPLYFYSGDSSTGQTNGQGLNAYGANWWAVSPAGAKVTKAASSGSSSNSGSGGY
jgi:predicted lipoprotein with Yx(FWY)xxD motif